MDTFADDVQFRLRAIGDVVIANGSLHPSIGECLQDAEILVVLLRRVVSLQFGCLEADAQTFVLAAVPDTFHPAGRSLQKEEAYRVARLSLIKHLSPRL